MNKADKIKLLQELAKSLICPTKYAKKHRVTRRTVYNMIADGRLLAVKIEGRQFVLR
jgi:excisionase family DNA binding protein